MQIFSPRMCGKFDEFHIQMLPKICLDDFPHLLHCRGRETRNMNLRFEILFFL
jgi:hypothetical protein